MKNIGILVIAFLMLSITGTAQKTKKPVAKTKATTTKKATKKIVKKNTFLTDLYVKQDDGSTISEMLNKGDKLVYAINARGQQYDFIVTLQGYSYEDGIQFDYEMTNEANTKGSVFISAQAKNEATNYTNYFRGGEVALNDASTVWLSQKNFGDMPTKKTEMSLDNSEPIVFYRQDNDEVTPTINFKGKQVKLDGFIINNGIDGKGDKTMWIHNGSGNPLILKMDIGFVVELKEIR